MNKETTVDLVLREDADGVATLTLNRPNARNALSRPLMAALHATLDAIDADPAVHVVVIRGAGPGFCAGHDLNRRIKHTEANARRLFQKAISGRKLADTGFAGIHCIDWQCQIE